MQIIGHHLINYKPFLTLNSEKMTKTNERVIFSFDENLIKFAINQKLDFSVYANSYEEIIISNALKASFIIIPEKLAKKAMKMADYYLFDSKIALLIQDEDQINKAIKLKVDAVIFESAIITN